MPPICGNTGENILNIRKNKGHICVRFESDTLTMIKSGNKDIKNKGGKMRATKKNGTQNELKPVFGTDIYV